MKLRCELCFHHCALDEGQTGFCRARANRDGAIVPLNYGKITSMALDPVEKKPLSRFHPGSQILSIASFGCNLRCPFCQNYHISMAAEGEQETIDLYPESVAEQAAALVYRGNIGVAYTYNEPLIGYEYIRDCAAAVHRRDLLNVLVTNGTIEEAPWRALLEHIDAANIDLKGFTPEWYKKLGGDLDTVKRNIQIAAERCHVEVTTLLVTDENDGEAEIRALCEWLSGIDRSIPLHLTRFIPRYKMQDRPPTPLGRLHRLVEIAGGYLDYVYPGNC